MNDDNILTGSMSDILKARRKQKEKKIAKKEREEKLYQEESKIIQNQNIKQRRKINKKNK